MALLLLTLDEAMVVGGFEGVNSDLVVKATGERDGIERVDPTCRRPAEEGANAGSEVRTTAPSRPVKVPRSSMAAMIPSSLVYA